MDALKIRFECLGSEEAWQLFRQKLGAVANNDSEIEELAKELARKCCGLPLALVVVARAMSTKRYRHEWYHAIDWIDNLHPDIQLPAMEGLFPVLRLSYINLSNSTIEKCFLSCSMFPQGYSISKEELIECWMGLGLLDDYDDIHQVQNAGHFVIGKLRAACLLESGEDGKVHVRMHDVLRGLASWLAGGCDDLANQPQTMLSSPKKWLVKAGIGLTSVPNDLHVSVERASLMHNHISSLPDKINCPDLLSLMLQWNLSLERIPNGLLEGMRSIKYLDLSGTAIKELPGTIGLLVLLEYLNLSSTSIEYLPNKLESLINLKYLDLRRTHLHKIPSKILKKLSVLRVLNMYASDYGDWEAYVGEGHGGGGSSNGATFQVFKYLMKLIALGITIKTESALQELFSMATPTRYIFVTDCSGSSSMRLPSSISTSSKIDACLHELTIECCQSLVELIIGGGEYRTKEFRWQASSL